MTKKDMGVPGNTVASQAEFDRHVYTYGQAMLSLGHIAHKYQQSGNAFRAIRFKAPQDIGGDWLAIVTVHLDGAPAVAFVFGDSLAACLVTVVNKIQNGSIRWKEDEYG